MVCSKFFLRFVGIRTYWSIIKYINFVIAFSDNSISSKSSSHNNYHNDHSCPPWKISIRLLVSRLIWSNWWRWIWWTRWGRRCDILTCIIRSVTEESLKAYTNSSFLTRYTFGIPTSISEIIKCTRIVYILSFSQSKEQEADWYEYIHF